MIPSGYNFAHAMTVECGDICKILIWSEYYILFKNNMHFDKFWITSS